MRPDFKKLLCERERALGHNPDNVKGVVRDRQRDEQQDYEDWAPGGKISIKKTNLRRSRKTKTLNENLNPLKNFLRKSVGRKWDEVFSEIAEVCPNDSAVNSHVYQHLYWYVCLHPVIIGGVPYKPWHEQGFYGVKKPHELQLLESSPRHLQLYVNAEGILCKAPQQPNEKGLFKEKQKLRSAYERVLVPGSAWAVKLDKIWYKAKLAPVPDKVPGDPKVVTHLNSDGTTYETVHETFFVPSFQDAYFARLPKEKLPSNFIPYYHVRGADSEVDRYMRMFKDYYGQNVYCQELKQMNSSEIRKHNLRNG